MSMNYKANMFDYDRFQNELGSALYEALETNISEPLISFIDENIKILKTPIAAPRANAICERFL